MSLSRNFFARDSAKVAKDLLGKKLVKESTSGRIIETEAYYGEKDPASHASNGKTKRNQLMFGEPGHAYVYLCYGNYWLFNIVTESKGTPGAVLIRALKPLDGVEKMKERRGTEKEGNLCDGPGKLTQALGINKNDNGKKVTEGSLRVEEYAEPEEISSSRRIGIKQGKEKQLRFLEPSFD